MSAAYRACRTADEIAQKRAQGLLLPPGIDNGQPLLPPPPLQAKLPQHKETHGRIVEAGHVNGQCGKRSMASILCLLLEGFYLRLRFRGKMFTDISAYRHAILSAVRIPVGAMPNTIATFAAARLATVRDLLAIGDLAVIHRMLHSPSSISFDTKQEAPHAPAQIQ